MDPKLAILLLFVADMISTYFYLRFYKKNYPKGNYTQLEQNPIIRTCIESVGLGKGMIMGALIVMAILWFVIKLTGTNFHYVLIGVFAMVNIFHYLNFAALFRLTKEKQVKGGNKDGK